MEVTLRGDRLGVILKIGLFVFLTLMGLVLFPSILNASFGYFIASALGVFLAAVVATAVVIRVFERRPLIDVGFGWSAGSPRNLAFGLLGGIVAASFVLLLPLVVGAAELQPDPERPGSLPSLLYVSGLLLFGAVGEEMLFRGYAFQILTQALGPAATILPMSVLFGVAHSSNQNVSSLGVINTIGFGIVLGYACFRSGDLWLSIGIHFGWNWTLPLFGVNLSGFTMGMSGFALRWKAGELWSGGNYGPEASLLTCGAIVGLLVFVRFAPIQTGSFTLVRPAPEV